ncbi:hypothetical protein BGZ63DRAFT_429227 [Mariannaea sp. PMI_226]|nr:hypothetical protein BGZ63DRAFT_429227 [Mariannaea sp. PMI_226]
MRSISLLSLAFTFPFLVRPFSVDSTFWIDREDCNYCYPYVACTDLEEGSCCQLNDGMLASSVSAHVSGYVGPGVLIRISARSVQRRDKCAVNLGSVIGCFAATYSITGAVWSATHRARLDGSDDPTVVETTKATACQQANSAAVNYHGFTYTVPLTNNTHLETVTKMAEDKEMDKLHAYILEHGEPSAISDPEISARSTQC